MATVMSEMYGAIHIPEGVTALDLFWDWVDATDLPEKLSVHFLRGEVWVDLFMEELFSHNQIKAALGITLAGLIVTEDLGMYAPDGMMLGNEAADFATRPDAMFVSTAAIETGRVRFVAGKKRGAQATRVIGTPDLVVEIVSPSTEDKDTEWLMSAYHDARIPEYWLIDAREDSAPRFDIFRRTEKEYVAGRKQAGWVKSAVLKRAFRLTRGTAKHGFPVYRLEVR